MVHLRLRDHRTVGVARQFVQAHFSPTKNEASEIKLTQHKAGRVVNRQTNHDYSSSHCSCCMKVKSVPANYSPKISSAKTVSNSIVLLGDTL